MNEKETDENRYGYATRCMYGILLDTINDRIEELEGEKRKLLALYRAKAGRDYTPIK